MLTRAELRSEDLQRVSGSARLAVRHAAGRSRVDRLYQDGAAKIRMPRVVDGPLQAVLINTAGGLTGGDRIAWQIDVADGAAATVTTQACEKVYRTLSGAADVRVTLGVGAGARLAWLPQETIVYDRSAFSRRVDADLAEGAECLLVEAAVFGRLSMGERTQSALFRDRWRIRQAGRLVHAEDFAIGPDAGASLKSRAVAAGGRAVATVLLVAPDAADRLDAVRHALGSRGAASSWHVAGSGKLLARIVSEDGYAMRNALVPVIEVLNGQAGLPRIWST